LAARGTVRGAFFSLGTTPSSDPRLDCARAIIKLLKVARKTAHVAIFTLTELVDAMVAAHERGVALTVVADAQQSQSPDNPAQKRALAKLQRAGIAVRLAVKQTALMHNKVGIFDGRTICTGSFNWTSAAEKHNDENLLVVDGTQVAAAYEKFVFQRILTTETLVEPEA